MLDFCTLFIDDFKMSEIFDKLWKFSTIFHRETSQAPTPTPQRPYDVSCGQNRYVTLPLVSSVTEEKHLPLYEENHLQETAPPCSLNTSIT